jgi:GTPase involved in cell partitioning and DNA repair
LVLPVPLGTTVLDEETGEVLGDIREPGSPFAGGAGWFSWLG